MGMLSQTEKDNLVLRNDHHFRKLLTALPNVSVQGYDKDRRVVYWNKSSELLYGYSEEEAMGNLLEDLIIPDFMREDIIKAHNTWLRDGIEIPAAELELIDKDRKRVSVFSSHVMLNRCTENPEMFCVDVDLSWQKRKEKEVQYLVQYDSQTGLFNKNSLFTYTKNALKKAHLDRQMTAAIFIGIDDLTHINNSYGYKAGDKLIQDAVQRLRNCVRPDDFIARYSGDVFVILITIKKQANLLEKIIHRVEQAARIPYLICGETRQVSLSAGICVDNFSEGSSNELLKNAEVAMNQAKLSGKNKSLFYESKFENKLLRIHAILSALNTAEEKGEFSLVYQPQYNQRKEVVSCEALIRWNCLQLGMVSPGEFIPLAENKNKIQAIDHWVVSTAIKQIRSWIDNGVQPVRIFVNLSGKSLTEVSFIQLMFDKIAQANIPFDLLGIEITEYVLISENEELLDNLNRLQSKGVEIALDDFGTGYSSLSYLTKFPLNYIKIDKAFIANAPDNSRDAAITKAIFALSNSLDMKVVCEGVEHEKHLSFIERENTDGLLQGYLLSKPVSADEIEVLLKSPQEHTSKSQ